MNPSDHKSQRCRWAWARFRETGLSTANSESSWLPVERGGDSRQARPYWAVPWIEVSEPYAKPPRTPTRMPAMRTLDEIEIDEPWAELVGIVAQGRVLDLSSCSTLEIRSSRLVGIRFEGVDGTEVDVHDTVFVNCDLSRVRFRSMTSSTLESCKLTGTDFGGGTVRDVRWSACRMALANLRMAELERVRWEDCTIEETDLFDSSLTDIDLEGTVLTDVNTDRARFERVDLRGALDLGLSTISSLKGALVAPEQLPALSFALAAALGADIERDPDPEIEMLS